MTAAERDDVILAHLPLVKYTMAKIATRLPPHVDRDDLVSAGIVGLLDAAARFDPKRNVLFRTFAAPRVRGSILDALRREDWLPRSLRDEICRMDTARSELEQETGRRPSSEELAGRLRVSRRKLNKLARTASSDTFRSLDNLSRADFEDSTDATHAGHDSELRPPERLILSEDKERLAEAMKKLPENERLVITLYYFEEMQLREIAEVLHVTSSRICQIHRAALLKLRGVMEQPERSRAAYAVA